MAVGAVGAERGVVMTKDEAGRQVELYAGSYASHRHQRLHGLVAADGG